MSQPPTLNLRSPGELAVMLPYLLGYQPGDALVLVCMRAGRVCLTAVRPSPRESSSRRRWTLYLPGSPRLTQRA